MTTFEFVHLTAEFAILLGILYLALLKSYFHEKGKNLATKEDIEEITQKVEAIKAGLQFSVQAKLSWRACEHDALVEYFVKYSAWLSAITDFSLTGISEETAGCLGELRAALNAVEREFAAAEAQLHLFVENADIRHQVSPIRLKTLDFHHHAQNFSFQYELAIYENKRGKLGESQERQLEIHAGYLARQAELYKRFKDQQRMHYQNLWPLVKEHREAISAHLRNLSAE